VILYIHQSSDLYGSDKVLLTLLQKMKGDGHPVVVVVPSHGPLVDELTGSGIETHIGPVGKIERRMLRGGIMRLGGEIGEAMRFFDRILAGRPVSLVHSNTLAVLGGGLWARRRRIPHIWHVHEIPTRPSWLRYVYCLLLLVLSRKVIFNSHATADFFLQKAPRLGRKSEVIWNGIEIPPVQEQIVPGLLRARLGMADGEILLTLVGRINWWKGQTLLVDAASRLWQEGVRNLHFLFVGSTVSGHEYLLSDLQQGMKASPARDKLHLLGFQPDIFSVWAETDIAIVPSLEPEPFGLVAIEAMSMGKPVIASGHGGLIEILDQGRCGILIEPGNIDDLVSAIVRLAQSPDVRASLGAKGLARVSQHFSAERYVSDVISVYGRYLDCR